jgi:syntaxin-binding protein 1
MHSRIRIAVARGRFVANFFFLCVFEKKEIQSICYLEQALATGTDKEYKAVKGSDVARDMTNTMKKADVSMGNKLRMMLLYIVTQMGLIKAENISSLSSTAGFGPAETKALESLRHFGFDVSKPRDKKKKTLLELLGLDGKPAERAQFELSRYVPPLKTVLLELAANTLDKEQFPYLVASEEIKDKAAAKRGPASLVPAAWADTGNNNNAAAASASASSDARDVIVFVIGGLSYSECRVAYEVAAELGRPVFVGSTTVYQPNEFVRQLQHLANAFPPPNLRIERLGGKVQNHG